MRHFDRCLSVSEKRGKEQWKNQTKDSGYLFGAIHMHVMGETTGKNLLKGKSIYSKHAIWATEV